jgi:hypothetical protein
MEGFDELQAQELHLFQTTLFIKKVWLLVVYKKLSANKSSAYIAVE